MPRKACRFALHATSPSNNGRVCVTTSCRGPVQHRTLCVSSPLRGLGPHLSSDQLQLQELRREVQSSFSTQLAKQAAAPSAQILQNRCVVCGFWTPDHTKVKSHLRQARRQVWQEVGEAAGKLCAGHSAPPSKDNLVLFAGGRCMRQEKTSTAMLFFFRSAYVGYGHTPHRSIGDSVRLRLSPRGLGP